MSTWHEIKDSLLGAALFFALGGLTVWLAIAQPAVPHTPVPDRPSPTAPVAIKHNGHLYLSYVEPRYPTPASAAVRDQLAGTDWHALGATFRAYTHGQEELSTLGFTTHYSTADLPILFIQEAGPTGAPIVPPPLKSPDAAAVLARVQGLGGK